MNIGYLNEILSRIEELKVMGKNVKVGDDIYNVMGIVRHGTELRLIILHYDESFRQHIEECEEAELNGTPGIPETNRIMMRKFRKNNETNPFDSVIKVFIDDSEFNVCSFEQSRLSEQDWENILTISSFLKNGWQPQDIDYQNINMLFITSLTLEGEYLSIPAFNEKPQLRFISGLRCVARQVEKPVTLDVGDNYPDKLVFQDETGEEHTVQINRVYLSDMWTEMDKVFSDPKLQEHITSEEITEQRLDFEKRFSEMCPRGLCYPVIEYECEEEISLEFYSKSYLDAEPLHRDRSMGFIVRPEKPQGVLGLKLRAAVIKEPVPVGTVRIEAELFRFILLTKSDDIVL